MVTLRIRLETEIARVRVCIDENPLKFSDSEAIIDLAEGNEYSLTWFLKGRPGQRYTLRVVSPRSAAANWTRVLDQTGKEGGQDWLVL